jgi:hypothetical protein
MQLPWIFVAVALGCLSGVFGTAPAAVALAAVATVAVLVAVMG